VSDSKARALLDRAARERERLKRHLLVAAALREVLSKDPIVVGGTAEEYWTAAEYHPTDLDLCAELNQEDRSSLRRFGFRMFGRHWQHPRIQVAIEFPDARIDGDESRTAEVNVGGGRARIIGLEDLYVDRLTQSTVTDHQGIEFQSALAVAAAGHDAIDWTYVRSRLKAISEDDPALGEHLRRNDARIRRRVRRALADLDR
jgi:predicted nucleotidyltransferase